MAREAALTLRPEGSAPLSLRDCTQELRPIFSGEMRRTVNGALLYAGITSHHKYRSLIYCRDKSSFACDGLWRGSVVEVGCIQRLVEKVRGASCTLTRIPVPGSISVKTLSGEEVALRAVTQRTLEFERPLEEGLASYRPLLTMRVLTFHLTSDAAGAAAGWQLWLEEV